MKLLKLSSLEIDTSAETDGDWVPVKNWTGLDPDQPYAVTELPDVAFLVRSTNYQPYKNARQKVAERLEEMRKDFDDGIVPDDVIEAENGRLMAEHLLLGWKGLDADYTPELALTALTKPAARIHRQMVMYCAAKVGRRKAEFIAAEADNLGK